MRMVCVSVNGDEPRTLPAGTPVAEVVPCLAGNGLPVLAALLNNEVVPLTHPVGINGDLVPLTLADTHGWRVYRWSLTFLLGMAFQETFPAALFRVRHPVGGGLFCNVEWPADSGDPADAIARVEARMRELADADLPIECVPLSYREAIDDLTRSGQHDQLHLLKYRNPPQVNLMKCGTYLDMRHEPLVHRTGRLDCFALTPYPPGFVLRLPAQDHPREVAPLNP